MYTSDLDSIIDASFLSVIGYLLCRSLHQQIRSHRAWRKCPHCRYLMHCEMDWSTDHWHCGRCAYANDEPQVEIWPDRAASILDRVAALGPILATRSVDRLGSTLNNVRAAAINRAAAEMCHDLTRAWTKTLILLVIPLLFVFGLIDYWTPGLLPSKLLRIAAFTYLVSDFVLGFRPKAWMRDVDLAALEIIAANPQPSCIGYLASAARGRRGSKAALTLVQLSERIDVRNLRVAPSSHLQALLALIHKKARKKEWTIVAACIRILSKSTHRPSVASLVHLTANKGTPDDIREQAASAIQAIEANIAREESMQNLLRAASPTETDPDQLLRSTDSDIT